MKKWKCTVCGYIHKGASPPDKCPVCGADKSLFQLMEEEAHDDIKSSSDATQPKPSTTTGVTQWKCTVCGYIHKGSEPPDQCPVCGADKSLFIPLDEEKAEETPADKDYRQAVPTEPETQPAPNPKSSKLIFMNKSLEDLMQILTQLHGHPIAVHIPNGLLPVSVFFTFIAVVFGSESFAIAARYNIGFVALAMPIVIGTGIVDWQNRFNRRMTSVFRIKIACAVVVSLLSIILAVWWIVNPDIYNAGLSSNGFFLLLNLINVATAGLAGWYGGKLVFHP